MRPKPILKNSRRTVEKSYQKVQKSVRPVVAVKVPKNRSEAFFERMKKKRSLTITDRSSYESDSRRRVKMNLKRAIREGIKSA